jgi:hypothetical protein
MAKQRDMERDEPQRTSQDEEQIRGVAESDDEFEDTDDLDEEEGDEDEEDEGTI